MKKVTAIIEDEDDDYRSFRVELLKQVDDFDPEGTATTTDGYKPFIENNRR